MVVIWCSKLLESYLQLLFTLINKIPDYEGCIFSICSNIIIPTSECLPSMFPDMKKATSIFIQIKNLFYTACYIHFSISSGGVFVPGFSIICRNFVPSLHWLNDSKWFKSEERPGNNREQHHCHAGLSPLFYCVSKPERQTYVSHKTAGCIRSKKALCSEQTLMWLMVDSLMDCNLLPFPILYPLLRQT